MDKIVKCKGGICPYCRSEDTDYEILNGGGEYNYLCNKCNPTIEELNIFKNLRTDEELNAHFLKISNKNKI